MILFNQQFIHDINKNRKNLEDKINYKTIENNRISKKPKTNVNDTPTGCK